MEEVKYELGQKIEVAAKLRRRSEYRQDKNIREWRNTEFKEWVEQPFKKVKTVMVIGVRTLSNGWNEYLMDYGNAYTALTYFKALLVVENLTQKPFYVKMP